MKCYGMICRNFLLDIYKKCLKNTSKKIPLIFSSSCDNDYKNPKYASVSGGNQSVIYIPFTQSYAISRCLFGEMEYWSIIKPWHNLSILGKISEWSFLISCFYTSFHFHINCWSYVPFNQPLAETINGRKMETYLWNFYTVLKPSTSEKERKNRKRATDSATTLCLLALVIIPFTFLFLSFTYLLCVLLHLTIGLFCSTV